ncbi:MAG: hypothetical protein KDA95_11550, partial [Acidimicrobiales bacterium]|nr:hypothetical protein [Acidimicrobiales bacterium]
MLSRLRAWAGRSTPRRWLPFLALSALIAGAVVIDAETPGLRPEQRDRSLDPTLLASMPLEDTLSTAWYCGGATAGGDGGLAEMTLVMANDAPEGATAEVTFLTAKSGNETEPQVVEVPANGSAVLSASDVLTADWVGAIVEVRGGRVAVERQVRGPLGYDASPCSTAAANNWFVPSGTTVRGSELYLSFFNPFPDTASIDVSFSTESGPRSPRALRGLSIPGRTIRVVAVGKLVTDRQTVAA